MAQDIKTTIAALDRDAVLDILGGVWLVSLLLGLLHLPGFLA